MAWWRISINLPSYHRRICPRHRNIYSPGVEKEATLCQFPLGDKVQRMLQCVKIWVCWLFIPVGSTGHLCGLSWMALQPHTVCEGYLVVGWGFCSAVEQRGGAKLQRAVPGESDGCSCGVSLSCSSLFICSTAAKPWSARQSDAVCSYFRALLHPIPPKMCV